MAIRSKKHQVRVSGRWEGGKRFRMEARGLSFEIDEPPERGGANTAPTPLEHFLGGCAACTGVIFTLVAQEMNFEFSGLSIEVTGEFDRAGVLGIEGISPHFQAITFEFRIQTGEPPERLARLKEEVLKRCPAHATLARSGAQMVDRWRIVG